MKIREVTEEDLPSLLALYEQLHLEEGWDLSVEEAQRIFDQIQHDPNHRIYCATVDEEIIGTFSLLIMDNLAHKGAPMGFVENVVVDRAWRGGGMGRRMMEFGMDLCRDQGCYKMTLSSHLKREAAHRFYESLGFRKHGFGYTVELTERTEPHEEPGPLHERTKTGHRREPNV